MITLFISTLFPNSHRAYEKGSPAFNQIVSEFGDTIVDAESGEINRKALGGIVFGHDSDMKRLTNIVWPCIRSLLREEIEKLSREGVDVCVMEAAVLFEAGWDEMVDEVWMVRVPPNVAIERLAKRNDIAIEDAQKRINSQWSNKGRMHKAHVIISNEWDERSTKMQVHGLTPPPAALSSFCPSALSPFLQLALFLFSRPPALSLLFCQWLRRQDIPPTSDPCNLRPTSPKEGRAIVHLGLTWPSSLELLRDLCRLKRLGST